MIAKNTFAAMCGLLLATSAGSALAAPGFIALEGSDATTFHHDTQYSTQLFNYLQGASAKSILVYNQSGTFNIDGSTGKTNTYVTSLAGVTLGNYSALYVQTPGTCCAADNTVLNTYGASVNTFISNGGNFAIGNYTGGTFDGVVPGGAAPAGTILGVGAGPGSTCTDGELVTAAGIAKGFTQPPVLGCWEHQGYQSSYWEGLGYLNLIASDPIGYDYADGTNKGSAFLALGGSLGTAAPEPTTWAMMLVGFYGLGSMVRRRRALTA